MKTKSGSIITLLNGGEITNKHAGDPSKKEADNHSYTYKDAVETSENKTKESECECKVTVGAIKSVCECVKKVNSYNCKSCDRCTYPSDVKNESKEVSLTPTIEGDLVSGSTIKSCDANI